MESFSNYNQNLGANENKLFEKLHDSIDKLVSGKDNIESSFSDTGGCSINVIKTKQSASQKLLNIVPKNTRGKTFKVDDKCKVKRVNTKN